MENQRLEYCSVVKFLALERQFPSNIFKRMVIVYGDHVPSSTTVFKWARRCKNRQLNIEDNLRYARLITTTNNETVKDVESLIVELQFSK